VGKCQGRVDGRQYECLFAELTGKILDDGYLRSEERLVIDGYLFPVFAILDVNLRYTDLIEHLYEVHIGGTIKVLVILYCLASEFVLEMQEETCRHILVRTTLVEYLQDALTTIVSYL
jgi:hypothetical protein